MQLLRVLLGKLKAPERMSQAAHSHHLAAKVRSRVDRLNQIDIC